MNNNREEISQGEAGEGGQSIITQATMQAGHIHTVLAEAAFPGGSARRRPASLSATSGFLSELSQQDGNTVNESWDSHH